MSYLQNQISAFKSSVNSSAGKVANKRTAGGTNPGPSPAPTHSSASRQNDLKRKRPEQSNVVYSQPADTGTGKNIMTQVTYAIDYLKDKNTPKTFTEIIGHLSVHNSGKDYQSMIKTILMKHDKVNYDPKNDGGEGTFSFRPVHDIRNPDKLLGHLQSQPTFKGLSVRELKDGWNGAEESIDELEDQGKLLVTRNKKDDHAKMVWPNDPSLSFTIDEEFQSVWHKIRLPEAGALADELEKAGLMPANKSGVVKANPVKQEKKTKKPRRGGKTTNLHMIGVLKDYSHLKK